MKPQLRLTKPERVNGRQQTALEAIELAHEKDGREFGFVTFGGPILNEGDVLEPYETMLVRALGKTEPSQLREGKKW